MDSASHDPAAAGPALPDPVTTDLAIVIVSWNVWDLLRACLHSIEQESQATEDPRVRRFGPQGQATLQVLVVDNASQDHTRDLLPKLFPWVGFLPQERNLGFTAANNRALRALGFGETSPLPASPLPQPLAWLSPSPLHEWRGEGVASSASRGRGEASPKPKARSARLLAPAKPRFSSRAMRRTWGNSWATIWGLPSWLALSTTSTSTRSQSGLRAAEAKTLSRQRPSSSRTL